MYVTVSTIDRLVIGIKNKAGRVCVVYMSFGEAYNIIGAGERLKKMCFAFYRSYIS